MTKIKDAEERDQFAKRLIEKDQLRKNVKRNNTEGISLNS